MIIFVGLHMCRVFYTAAYKPPREFNWVIGLGLFLLTLGLSFTGYLLPWDQLAYWAITVGTGIAGYAPVIGAKMRFILLGGHTVGQAALIRFYVLHVIALPVVMALVDRDSPLAVWQGRRPGAARGAGAGAAQAQMPAAALPQTKSYGLMELARGTTPCGRRADRRPRLHLAAPAVPRDPGLPVRLRPGAGAGDPLERAAGRDRQYGVPAEPRQGAWYFLGLQELVSHSAFWGGVVVPGLIVTALAVLPYLDRKPKGVGVWFSGERKVAIAIFTVCLVTMLTLTVIGSQFRGPNWALQAPWKPHVAAEERSP